MYQQTVAIIVISETALSDKEALQLILNEVEIPNWQVKKLSVIPENENLIFFEIDLMYKLYDAVIVIECDTHTDLSYNLFGILAKMFHQELVSCESLDTNKYVNGTANILVPKFAKILDHFEGVNLQIPIIHLQRIFIVKSRTLSTSFDILKAYLKDSKFPKVFEKEFNFIMNGTPLDDLLATKYGVHISLQKTGEIAKLLLQSNSFDNFFKCEKHLREKFGSRISGTNPTDIALFSSLFHSVDCSLKVAIEVSMVEFILLRT